MPIASYDKFIEPLLRLLEERPEGIRTADAQQILADQFGITPDERREMLPSGTYPVYKSRIGWASDRLKRAGISVSLRRGFWQLTDEGFDYARKYKKLPAEELKRIAHPGRNSSVFDEEKPVSTLLGHTESSEELSASSPDDRINDALAEIQDSLRRDLLAEIWSRDPDFFERLVLQVLKAMGYGADDRSLDHSGSPGDDGIDGVISLDQLGLDKVYVQAKRYAEDRPISKEAIHSFIGALHLKGANKGVFITTSRFTSGATQAGDDVRGLNLRLINGVELAQMMIKNQVGVRHEPLPIPKIDLDFWGDE